MVEHLLDGGEAPPPSEVREFNSYLLSGLFHVFLPCYPEWTHMHACIDCFCTRECVVVYARMCVCVCVCILVVQVLVSITGI